MYYSDRFRMDDVSAIRNIEVAVFGRVLLWCINGTSIRTAYQCSLERGIPFWEVAAYRGSTVYVQ